MIQIVESLDQLTPRQLVTAYNAGQNVLGRTEDDHVKKFRDSKTALERVARVVQDIEKMFGYAVITITEKADETIIGWRTERVPASVGAAATPPEENGEEKKDEEKPADPKPAEPAARAVGGGATTLDLSAELHVLVENNPKRPASRAWETFELYWQVRKMDKPTGEEFVKAMIAAGFPRKLGLSTLHWDISHKFVRLGPEELAPPKVEEVPATKEEPKSEEKPAQESTEEKLTPEETERRLIELRDKITQAIAERGTAEGEDSATDGDESHEPDAGE